MKSRITQLKEFLKEEPNDSFLIYALSLEYVKENYIELSIQTLLELNQKDENYLAVYYQLGKLFQSINEIEKATTFFDRGMEVAEKEGNMKTFSELKEAKNVMLDIDEFDD
jgi:tetratricopeptide (TPR) repeat protein